MEAHVDTSKVSTRNQATEDRQGGKQQGPHRTDGPSGEGKRDEEDASASKLHTQ